MALWVIRDQATLWQRKAAMCERIWFAAWRLACLSQAELQSVIKAVLKGAFHWLIEAAGAALFALLLSKEKPHTNTLTDVYTQEKTAQEGLR